MKRTKNYYVSRKNVLTWISALLGLCAAAGYIAGVTCLKGAGVDGITVWFRAVLPVLAALYFVLTVLIKGEERLYRISLTYWLLAICYWVGFLHEGHAWYWVVALAVGLFALALVLHQCLAGKWGGDWLIILIPGLTLAGLIWRILPVLKGSADWSGWLRRGPDCLMMLAFIVLCFAFHTRPQDGTHWPTWGDRPDGRKLRSLDPINRVGVYIMPNRNGAHIQYKGSVEITALEKYIRQKKLNGFEGFGVTEAFLAAYVRVIAKYPSANRFISGQQIYSRDEDIQFCMTIKKELSTDASETIIKLHLNPHDTAADVYQKFHAAVAEVKKTEELDSSFDGVAALIGAIPGVLLKFTIWFLKCLDYFGLIPKFLLEVSPFHGSIYFTSMGSLGIPAIYHHLYDFGNIPAFCAFGCKRRAKELDADGNPVDRKYIDYTFTLDERIVDGFYYATSFKYFQKLLQHPERLDEPPETVNHDVD